MIFEEIKSKLETVLSKKRFVHSINVMNTACALAKKHGVDEEKALLAGLLHDCARYLSNEEALMMCERFGIEVGNITRLQPVLLHGPVGSYVAKEEYGVLDNEICHAIYYHTTGKENMSTLDKIIYVADYIEPGRSFAGVENVRNQAFKNLDMAMLISLDQGIGHLMVKGALIHPDSISARNYLLMKATN